MGGFLGALKGAGKAIGRTEKKRFQKRVGLSSPMKGEGGGPVADIVREATRKKRSSGKGRV